METSECQDESPSEVKWPIAPDAYIPNSVIRGFIRMLKRAKWDQEREEDEEDEFLVGPYAEDYKSLRAKRRPKKDQKMSYMQWDYRPDLDFPIRNTSESQEDDLKGEKLSEQEKEKDEDKIKANLKLPGMRGGNHKMEKVGVDFALENKRSDLFNGLVTNPKVSYDLSRKKIKTAQEEGEDESNQVTVVQNEIHETSKGNEEMPDPTAQMMVSFQNPQTLLKHQRPKRQQSKSDLDAKNITLNSESSNTKIQSKNDNEIPPITNEQKMTGEENTTKIKETQGFGREELPKFSLKKISSLSSSSERVSSLEKEQAVPHSEQREVKKPTDETKLPSKQNLFGTWDDKLQATTEKQDIEKVMNKPIKPTVKSPAPAPPSQSVQYSFALADTPTLKNTVTDSLPLDEEKKQFRNPLPRKQMKATNSGQKPQPMVPVPKEHVSTSSRDPIQAQVDNKVLELYKQFKKRNWVSSKPHGKLSSTDFHRSRSQCFFSETKLEGLGTAESLYQQGSGEKAEGEPMRPLDQSGLWQLIMNGVSESIDEDALWGLLQERSKDHSSSGFSGMMDQSSIGRQNRAKLTIDESISARFGAAQESMDNATSRELIRDRPSDFQARTEDIRGHSRSKDDGIQGSNTSLSMSMDQNSFSTLHIEGYAYLRNAPRRLSDLALGTINQAVLRWSTDGSSTESMAGLGRLGVVNKAMLTFEGGQRGLGTRESSLHSAYSLQPTIQTGLVEKNYISDTHRSISERLGPGQSSSERSSHFSHRATRPERTETIEDTADKTGQKDKSLLWPVGQSSAEGREGFDEFMNGSYDRRRQSIGEIIQSGCSEGQLKQSKSPSIAGFGRRGIGASPKDKSGNLKQSVPGYPQSTAGTRPEDKSQDLFGLQTVKSKVHTPGLLTSSEPDHLLKALSQNRHGGKNKTKPMPKWRQELYQLIFLYGFCSPQTAKLLARENWKQAEPQRTKQQRDNIELYEFLDAITPSELHERVVRKVHFHNTLDRATSDFHCIFPLPSINNFITLEKYSETEYGKLVFEWERGGHKEEQMNVVNASVAV